MTYKVLSGYVQGTGVGYYLTSGFAYAGLSVTATGTVEGVAGVNAVHTPTHATAGFAGLLVNKNVPVINSGQIIGGQGGAGGAPASVSVTIGTAGYVGGYGVTFHVAGYLHNLATISGGGGGASGGGTAAGGEGGAGVVAYKAATLANGGLIRGGAGGGGGTSTTGSGGGAAGQGQRGGEAVVMRQGGTETNSGTLTGGDGGVGGLGTIGVGGQGGAGGAALFEDGGGTFGNAGAIYGGKGGHGGQGVSGGGNGGRGGSGVELFAAATLTNSGLIVGGTGGAGGAGSPTGFAGAQGYGVYLLASGAVINATQTATITGGIGVKTRAAYVVTVTNYGTIQGTGGVAVQLNDAADRLIDEAGSVIIGKAVGGGGTLELAPGFGTISGMGLPSGATFSDFAAYEVDSGGDWTIAGDNDVPLGATLSNAGVLTLTGTLTNYSLVTTSNSYALTVAATGRLVNLVGGSISGASHDGLVVGGFAMNYGSVTGANTGVDLQTGGWLLNRAGGVVEGATGVAGFGAGTLQNYGSVAGTGLAAVEMISGGVLANYKGGVISGAGDGFIGFGVTAGNAGTIRGSGAATYAGFLVENSVATNLAGGVMEGYSGAVLDSSTLANAGLIDGYSYAGVYANSGGTGPSRVTNQAAGTIEGAKFGVYAKGSVTVTNFGSIDGTSGTAVAFGAPGGRLVVKSGSHLTGAALGGGGTLEFADGGGGFTLTAAGASGGGISLASSGFAAYQLDAGSWTMSAASTIAAGQSVLDMGALNVSGTLANAGTLGAGASGVISLDGAVTGVGAVSALDTAAGGEIDIANAASAQVLGTLINAGVIALAGATNKSDLRILAGGAALTGGGTVTMGGPKARIFGVSATATLTNADNTIAGVGSIGVNDMTLINQAGGVIEATGLLTVRDAAGHSLTNSGLIEANATGKLALVSETINQSGGGKILAAGGLVTLQGVDFIGGTLTTTGAGRINVDGGGAILDGGASPVTNSGLLQVTGGETLTVDGSVINSGKLDLHAARLFVTAAGVTLSGAGQVNLNNSSTNVIVGATAAATLTNVNDRIAGSGNLGDGLMTLVNQAAGQIIGNQGVALTIDTGAHAIVNAGLIENVGKGGTLVKSAVNNTGTLKAVTAGTLTLQGAVTGSGVAQINGGTLYVQQVFAENVAFTGSTGVLKLGDSQAYTGQVTGLSKTGTNSLDLADIAFSNTKTKASFSGTTASGVLTVTDGTHTAKITLVGDYLGSTFTVSTDGHTGTKVVDPSAPAGPAPLAQAMAGFGRGGDVDLNRALHGPPSAFAPLLAHAGHRCAPV